MKIKISNSIQYIAMLTLLSSSQDMLNSGSGVKLLETSMFILSFNPFLCKKFKNLWQFDQTINHKR